MQESGCSLGVWTTNWVHEYESRRGGKKFDGYNDDNFNGVYHMGDGSNHTGMVIYHYIFFFIRVEWVQVDI